MRFVRPLTALLGALVVLIGLFPSQTAEAQRTKFTYQGYLEQNGAPVQGDRDLQFSLFDSESGSSQIGSTITIQDVGVTDGVFSVELNFGAVFADATRYLEVAVRDASASGAFTTLSPREAIRPAPIASALPNVTVDANGNVGIGTTTPGSQLSVNGPIETTSGGVTLPDGTVLQGASDLGGSGSTWNLNGNGGTSPGTDFLGTTDDTPLELKVNGVRTLRIEPPVVDANGNKSPNMIGGYRANSIDQGVAGATIAGGGGENGGSMFPNQIEASYGTIGGGVGNTISDAAGTVGGGSQNTASDGFATVAGGIDNTAGGSASTIAGGEGNRAAGGSATVAGGGSNAASKLAATVGGGNRNRAGGTYSTVPGGLHNEARAPYSFAGGADASVQSSHDGTFVWADASDTDFQDPDSLVSTGKNQFLIRAEGGVGIGTNAPSSPLTVDGTIESTTDGLKLPDGTILKEAADLGVSTNANGAVDLSDDDGVIASGTFNSGGSIPSEGAGTRMMWYPEKAAFRAGRIMDDGGSPNQDESTFWNALYIGEESVAMGYNTKASGSSSLAVGHETTASGWGAATFGLNTLASANGATAMGTGTEANGRYSLAIGRVTTASAEYATAMGRSTTAASSSSLSIGKYNEANTSSDNTLFVAGNGSDYNNRSDALVLKKNGDLALGPSSPTARLHVTKDLSNRGVNDNPGGNMVLFENTNDGNKPDVMGLQAGPSSPGNGVTYLNFYTRAGNTIGAVEGNGSGGVNYRTSGSDYAEELPMRPGAPTASPRDLVAVRGGEVTLDTKNARRLMIVTDRAAVTGNVSSGGSTARVPVAFVGQVPVQLRGAADVGDLVVASGDNDGTARAVSPADYLPGDHGPIAGRAWSAKSSSATGTVTVAVGLDQSGALGQRLEHQRATIESQREKLQSQQDQIDALRERLRELETIVREK